jgi:hypothetical protein
MERVLCAKRPCFLYLIFFLDLLCRNMGVVDGLGMGWKIVYGHLRDMLCMIGIGQNV